MFLKRHNVISPTGWEQLNCFIGAFILLLLIKTALFTLWDVITSQTWLAIPLHDINTIMLYFLTGWNSSMKEETIISRKMMRIKAENRSEKTLTGIAFLLLLSLSQFSLTTEMGKCSIKTHSQVQLPNACEYNWTFVPLKAQQQRPLLHLLEAIAKALESPQKVLLLNQLQLWLHWRIQFWASF